MISFWATVLLILTLKKDKIIDNNKNFTAFYGLDTVGVETGTCQSRNWNRNK